MDDPECPLTEEELARPIVWIGEMPYSILTVEELEREMDAATGANPELPEEAGGPSSGLSGNAISPASSARPPTSSASAC